MFEWKEKYLLGITGIDNQHKELVAVTGRLFAAMQSGAGKDVLDTTLSELILYTRKHFLTEEMLLANYDYPEMEAHKAEHRALTEDVLRYQRDFRSGNTGLSIELLTFLRDWLETHICQSDRNYAVYLRHKGVR